MNKTRWVLLAIAALLIPIALGVIVFYSVSSGNNAAAMSDAISDKNVNLSDVDPQTTELSHENKAVDVAGEMSEKPGDTIEQSGTEPAESGKTPVQSSIEPGSSEAPVASDSVTSVSNHSEPGNQAIETQGQNDEPKLEWLELEPNVPDNLAFEIHQNGIPEEERISQVFPYTYTDLEGILTFRGGPFRDRPSWGISSIAEKKLSIKWKYFTPFTSSWGGGGGWTGQPAAVRWPAETRALMNLYPEYKAKDGFVEILFASLNGNIYFLDMETGLPSRDKIKIGNPFKGSLSVDPRGCPLLYAGDGIADTRNFGFRIYSLIDGSILHFQNGRDKFAYRYWGAFDSSAAFNPLSDTLFVCGENGLFYKIQLNSKLDLQNAAIEIEPSIEKYRYKIKGNVFQGIENSPVFYNHYAFFADNGGWIQAIDLDSLEPVWTFDNEDDTDATMVLSVEDSIPYLYCGNEVDHQGTKGTSHIRKLNALTGTLVWEKGYECLSIHKPKPVNGGLLATGAMGKKNLDDRVIFTLARYGGISKGLMVALSKETGEELWRLPMDHYAWSSPVDFYDADGNGFIIQCNSAGNMMLIDGMSGEVLDMINLGSNIESSPIVFEDFVVVATRGGQVYCIEIS